ncbi:TPA: nucleotidyl transferase AbiEii/AbiGii toxin family protein, partial [Escherichia coli]|nr:nucleotidyl transferase AbiEii/AbiGii toxin family protein [Escherichia coli]
MDKTSPYYRQVALLVRALPWVANESCFALKGGTAINLFIHDFPRLSVDIDLAWIPLESREVALPNVREALTRIAAELEAQTGIRAVLQTHNPDEMRIIVTTDDAQIKIEVSPVARGTLYPPQERDIVGAVEEEFGFAALPVVSLPDLYGGKLCAALDRQHPRDFYDVKMLLDTQGIDRSIFNGFIAYLLSHNRPLSEVLNPRWKDITEPFQNEFSGMTFEEVSLEELKEVPERMLSALKTHFTQQDFDFLLSFKRG